MFGASWLPVEISLSMTRLKGLQHVLGRLHAVLDRDFAHEHDQAARRILERAARGAGVALRAGPDLFLHRVVDALEILRPKQLDDLARTSSRSSAPTGRSRCRCRS